jgi:hypothetical protein
MNEVDDFLERHGDEIGVIVSMFNGRTPDNRRVIDFVATSERCRRVHGRALNEEEFNIALLALEGDHALDDR